MDVGDLLAGRGMTGGLIRLDKFVVKFCFLGLRSVVGCWFFGYLLVV